MDYEGGNGGNGGGGLPHAYQYSDDIDEWKNGDQSNKPNHSNANSFDDVDADDDGGGLPQRYDSSKSLQEKTDPDKKVAKALFDYPGGYRSNELTFHRGTSLIITKEKEGWVYGHYELEPSLTGWFPKSYCQIIC